MTILSVIYQLKNLLNTIKKVSFSPEILFFCPIFGLFFYCQLACFLIGGQSEPCYMYGGTLCLGGPKVLNKSSGT